MSQIYTDKERESKLSTNPKPRGKAIIRRCHKSPQEYKNSRPGSHLFAPSVLICDICGLSLFVSFVPLCGVPRSEPHAKAPAFSQNLVKGTEVQVRESFSVFFVTLCMGIKKPVNT